MNGEGVGLMRRRAVLAGIAGTAGAVLAQQLQVLARPVVAPMQRATTAFAGRKIGDPWT